MNMSDGCFYDGLSQRAADVGMRRAGLHPRTHFSQAGIRPNWDNFWGKSMHL